MTQPLGLVLGRDPADGGDRPGARDLVGARILILDEPTSSLDAHETEQLFGVMRKLRGRASSIVFITHFLDQVYAVADRITVLRNGRLVGTYATSPSSRASS